MSPYLRLVRISVSVIIAAILGLFVLHFLGNLQRFGEFNHPFKELPFVIFADAGDQDLAPLGTKASFAAAQNLDYQVIPALPLHLSADNQWVIFPLERLEQSTDGQGVVEIHTWEKLSKLNAGQGLGLLRLEDYLNEFKPEWLLIDIRSRSREGITSLLKVLDAADLKEHVLVKSPYPQIINELRKERAFWLFGADSTSLARWEVMAALFILNTAEIRADFLFTSNNSRSTRPVGAKVISEFQRRNKLIFIQDNAFDPAQSKNLGLARGIMTTRPSAALKMLGPYIKK